MTRRGVFCPGLASAMVCGGVECVCLRCLDVATWPSGEVVVAAGVRLTNRRCVKFPQISTLMATRPKASEDCQEHCVLRPLPSPAPFAPAGVGYFACDERGI